MNRIEFMKQLEALLQNIAPTEREEALQYYNDYFEDAGSENEQSVIEALGNPARVAENIKKDLYGNGYGDNGNQQAVASDKAVIPYADEMKKEGDSTNATPHSVHGSQKERMSTGTIVLIVVLCILASPVLLGAGSGLLGLLAGLIVSWFAFIIAFGAAALSLFIAFLILVIVGIMVLFSEPLGGIALIGGGMLCGGIGILFLMLAVAMAGIATPAICNVMAGLIKKLINRK